MPNFLSLMELKERLHITFDDDDAELQGYIDAAESYLADPQNGILRRPVLATEFVERFSGFRTVALAFPDEVTSVSITYVDADGAEHDLPPIYRVEDGALILNDGENWPQARSATVTYTAGWEYDFVPPAIREAGYFIARSYYEQGHEIDQARFRSVVSFMVAGYRRVGL